MALPPATAMDRFSSAEGLAASRAEAAALAASEQDSSDESFGDGRAADVRQRGTQAADRGALDEPTSDPDSPGAHQNTNLTP